MLYCKALEISSFYTSVPKIMIICYTVFEVCMWHICCNCCFSFWVIFCPFYPLPPPPNSPQFLKIKQATGDIIILHVCTKSTIRWYKVPEIWCITDGQMDGQMDRLMEGWMDQQMEKWHIEVGASSKKSYRIWLLLWV